MVTDQNQSKRNWLLEVLNCYEGRLIQYVSNIVGDIEQARDVVQETFLKLWEVKRSKVEDHLEQWLYTVSRNKAFDLKKKKKRMFQLELNKDYAADNVSTPVANIELKETKGSILKAIKALPANQREVICLKFQNELSYKEISKITGLSVSNVGFLIHTGIKSMRSLLKQNNKQEYIKGNV